MKILRIAISLLFGLLLIIFAAEPALAFCGFYVAKADSSLYNQASQVIIARDGDRTVLTMSNDYQGEAEDFAMVVPVPTILEEEQVHIGESKTLERLNGFSAPRLVEYFDPDPCAKPRRDRFFKNADQLSTRSSIAFRNQSVDTLGVTVESQFRVGEYDIVILSAKESDGLETWLIQNGFEKLRPISIAYESPKFMLPIRLGMMNAKGDRDLLVYLLSPKGQVELTNYRTVKILSNTAIPEFVQTEFKDFYQSMFQQSYEQENKRVAFLEYAWDMSSCDPCSAEPLDPDELKDAGVFWLDQPNSNNRWSNSNVFITRLHVRYNRDNFPEDLKFQSTSDRSNFQGRYVVRHPFMGDLTCRAASDYQQEIVRRQEAEAHNLARLTGWDIQDIRGKIIAESKSVPWWRSIWE